jgi:hypothetical protein
MDFIIKAIAVLAVLGVSGMGLTVLAQMMTKIGNLL